jgi:hypothetical protein
VRVIPPGRIVATFVAAKPTYVPLTNRWKCPCLALLAFPTLAGAKVKFRGATTTLIDFPDWLALVSVIDGFAAVELLDVDRATPPNPASDTAAALIQTTGVLIARLLSDMSTSP